MKDKHKVTESCNTCKHFEGQNLKGTVIFFSWWTMINGHVACKETCNLLVQFASAGWNTVPDQPCLLNYWSVWEELVSICSTMNPGALPPRWEHYLQQLQEVRRLRAISQGWSARGDVYMSRLSKLASGDKHGDFKQTDDQQENNQLMPQLNRG